MSGSELSKSSQKIIAESGAALPGHPGSTADEAVAQPNVKQATSTNPIETLLSIASLVKIQKFFMLISEVISDRVLH